MGERPCVEELLAGYALNRFEGLNNEPDMEVPWAYHYVGRPDRTAEVVHAAVHQMFGLGRGGLPGNDDSGGLSSWYVWASLGLFPVAGQSLYLLNAPVVLPVAHPAGRARSWPIETTGFVEPRARRPGAVRAVRDASTAARVEQSWLTGPRPAPRRPAWCRRSVPSRRAWGTTAPPARPVRPGRRTR